MSFELRQEGVQHRLMDNSEPRIQNSKSEYSIPDRVLVVGLGASGVGCVKFLSGLGRKVTVTDVKQETELSNSREELAGMPFVGRFGGHDRRDFLDHELIVISPGIVTHHPFLEEARRKGTRVISPFIIPTITLF